MTTSETLGMSRVPSKGVAPTAKPASTLLVSGLARRVRERGLVLWLDPEGHYSTLVDALEHCGFGFGYPVVAFRGSFLELMLALEHYGNELHPEHVLVHLGGLNKETVTETPVFELYEAGTVFEKNLGSLIREAALGVVAPEEIDAFLRESEVTLAKADEWLSRHKAEPRDNFTVLLEGLGIDDVAIGIVAGDSRLTSRLPASGDELFAFLSKGLGIDDAWRTFRIGADRELTPAAMATLVGGWLMAVEFVHDLRDTPTMPELLALTKIGAPAKECRRLATRLRERHPEVYEQIALELQEHLLLERTSHHAESLGSIDTFRFEEAATRAAALSALHDGQWQKAEAYAADRTIEQCFWVKRSPTLQRTWDIIRQAAFTGQSLTETAKALDRCASLDEAVSRYVEKLAPVDRAHRLFEQRAHANLASDLDDYEALLNVRTEVRKAYREWADANTRRFFEMCSKYGPLPSRDLRQRSFYDDVVQPQIESGGGVALFMVDALRFEMAQGLAEELKREKFRVKLTPRLAELPTITAVGMNALAPVEKAGRLRPVVKNGGILGWTTPTGEFSVCEPADRVKQMKSRSLGPSGNAEDFELDEFKEMTSTQLKGRLKKKPGLVVVKSLEIDKAGEHGLHLGTFDQTLTLLKTAIALLSQQGIASFILVSDHGFLLQDPTTQNVPIGSNMRVASRRHAFLDQPSGASDVLEVRLSALEYEVEPSKDAYLVFRPDTAVWKTKETVAPFVHGGNSLQERVIPVLEIDRAATRGNTTSRYEVVARAEPAQLGRQRLRVAVRLQTRQSGTLGFLTPPAISLALRVPGRPDIAIELLEVEPPATLSDGRVHIPPNRAEVLVEFHLEGMNESERVRVELYHPDAREDVTSKIVEGFFDVDRNRRLPKDPSKRKSSAPPPAEIRNPTPAPMPAVVHAAAKPSVPPTKASEWAELIEDEGFRRVFGIVAERRLINEAELQQVLGSAMRVRSFARHFDALVVRLPFEIEVRTVNGLKTYVRKD